MRNGYLFCWKQNLREEKMFNFYNTKKCKKNKNNKQQYFVTPFEKKYIFIFIFSIGPGYTNNKGYKK
jgi:hypothetical protein